MRTYQITVKRLIDFEKLDQDDQEEWPEKITEIRFIAENEEKALDEFHDNYPIAVLDDFDISIEPFTGKDYCDDCDDERADFVNGVCQNCLAFEIEYIEKDIRVLESNYKDMVFTKYRIEIFDLIQKAKSDLLRMRLKTPEGQKLVEEMKKQGELS